MVSLKYSFTFISIIWGVCYTTAAYANEYKCFDSNGKRFLSCSLFSSAAIQNDLNTASKLGNLLVIQSTVSSGVSLNKVVKDGTRLVAGAYLPLGLASTKESVNELIRLGADPNASDDLRYRPLAHAITRKNTDVIRELVSSGADLDNIGRGESALMLAAKIGSANIVGLLVSLGADVNHAVKGTTPLMVAAENLSLEVIRILLYLGADVNYLSDQGTALSKLFGFYTRGEKYSALRLNIVKELITAGVNVNLRSKGSYEYETNWTPLMSAVNNSIDGLDIVKELLKACADIKSVVYNLSGHNGKTALNIATENVAVYGSNPPRYAIDMFAFLADNKDYKCNK